MNIVEYQPFWTQAESLMRSKLEALAELLRDKSEYTLREIYQSGDEDFQLNLDMCRGDVTVLGLEFVLLDADTHGADKGVGVKFNLIGNGGLVLGGYAPYNYTDKAFTMDIGEMCSRIEALDVASMASHILDETLIDPYLLKELEALQA